MRLVDPGRANAAAEEGWVFCKGAWQQRSMDYRSFTLDQPNFILGETMSRISVKARDGGQLNVEVNEFTTLMDVLRDHSVEGILAECDGCCSCGTCHVYVNSEDLTHLPEMNCDEDAVLAVAEHRQRNSRLACQISIGARSAPLRITIPPGA